MYTQWISRCIATARERIPGSIDNDVTGVSERSQQGGNLKDDGYITRLIKYPGRKVSVTTVADNGNNDRTWILCRNT
ncbi:MULTISPECIES: hypothetical protein [Photorhabdus]|uniref:Uncharacterized protein n=2 Tax=Photorhabdus TaxID=29487 RepID=A0ABX0AZS3_9GAMM|nr:MULTISPECIES: hypothetical protein [Photorhabdus]MCC8372979.1 hypothetical protein [Photorhabdus bodei]MCC8463231.1 hypothetical protein [Photorhabdus bodei]MCT8352604.1 hypothetical protein [Photorhabdus kayaii]MDB6366364.1 hypothetical protein [Photorhabdus bodei]MDB6373403.1 hypothetical protein [Photorhabdus bodei]